MCDGELGGCGGEPLPRERPRDRCDSRCVKCKDGSPVVSIRAGDAFCKSCFKDYFIHKFRAMLGKNRCIYPGEKVLLAFSGGLASSSMLRQVQEGLNREAAKKLRFRPGIIYIDEGAVCGRSLDERAKTCRQVGAILRATGFPCHLVFLEEVFDLPTSVLNSLTQSPLDQAPSYKEAVAVFTRWQQQQREKRADAATSLEDQLAECSMQGFPWQERLAVLNEAGSSLASHAEELARLFGGVKSLTAKEELLQTFRTHLMLHVARRNGYTKVMVGDSCTRVSVRLLTNLSLGRGAFLAMDTGFLDSRYGDVLILRPMREYPAKEIAFYNYLFGVPTVFMPGLDTKASDRASIHLLIESFLCKLQSEFPSTLSTVYRTGEKLSTVPPEVPTDVSTAPARCLLCLCPLDTHLEDGSSLQATLLSEKLSQRLPAEDGCCGGGTQGGCCKAPPAGIETSQLVPLLCYGCRLTVKELSCVESLPPYIHEEAKRQQCRAAMKQEIQEFLLEDDT
ncbi:cytoplasmic tRNA 2-thiolation protein 2 isoform X1 [Ahaetulla prasina]|uniref:cytoplasmic tRNA 2-thiolation protein 2 isoform X1 n=1 Tax=Ahaetulla prasina TaxID=499056 RepID=UPI00264845B1|nr:cytoplasmic tRNA 2-thiolation protein 2 isoform X1 [Ahaetulla prasina]